MWHCKSPWKSVGENPKNFVYIGIGWSATIACTGGGTVDAALLKPANAVLREEKGLQGIARCRLARKDATRRSYGDEFDDTQSRRTN